MKTLTRLKILDRFCDAYEQELVVKKAGHNLGSNLATYFKQVDEHSPRIPQELRSEIKVEILAMSIGYYLKQGTPIKEACDEIQESCADLDLEAELNLATLSLSNQEDASSQLGETRVTRKMLDALSPSLPIEENLDFVRSSQNRIRSKRLGRYEIKRRIGAGGFGVVYQAFDPVMNRDVAIKIPRLSLLGSETARRLLEEETNTLARLNHSGIVTAFHAEEVDGYFILVSEYVEGSNLQQWLDERKGAQSLEQATKIVIQICEALAHAHQLGIIHRDLKPSNILVYSDHEDGVEKIKVTDFGLAKVVEGESVRTSTFAGAGTLAYISPERLTKRETASFSCDIYAIGVIMFRILSGRLPFDEENEIELLSQIVERQAPELNSVNKNVSDSMSAIVSKCLMKQPSDRYESVQKLRSDLESCLNGGPVSAKPLGWTGAFRHWASGKRRVFEAALYGLVLNIALVLWSLIFVPIYYGFDLLDPLAIPRVDELVFSSATLISCCCLPLSWGAINVLRGRFRSLIPTFVIAFLNLILMGLFLTNVVKMDFGGLYENRNTRLAAFSLLMILMSYQVFSYGVAIYSNRRQKSAHQE